MNRVVLRIFVALSLLSASASVLLGAKVLEGAVVMDEFVRTATRGVDRSDPERVALAISGEVYLRTNRVLESAALPLYERLEATSFFNVSSPVSVQFGMYGLIGQAQLGPCGTMTRVTLDALGHVGVPARKLQLLHDESGTGGGHTMLEFRSGDRWLVLSPSDDSFVWRRYDGHIATLDEIRADPTIFAQIYKRYPAYPYRFDNPSHIRWAKLPGPVQGFFRLILGKRGYDNALTPRLYDQPRELLLLVSLSALIAFSLAALGTWNAGRRKLETAEEWSAAA